MNTKHEFIAPSVNIDGRVICPPGWMYIIAYALNGIQWAIDEADKPEFKETIKEFIKKEKEAEAIQEIAALEARIAAIKNSIGLQV